jgi:hypothetical protein
MPQAPMVFDAGSVSELSGLSVDLQTVHREPVALKVTGQDIMGQGTGALYLLQLDDDRAGFRRTYPHWKHLFACGITQHRYRHSIGIEKKTLNVKLNHCHTSFT